MQTTWARPPTTWKPPYENFWGRLARGDQEAVSDFYSWLAAYTMPFVAGPERRQLAASLQTYAPPALREWARRNERLTLFSREPNFGWENWNWDTSDVRWRAFAEGIKKAREAFASTLKKDDKAGEVRLPTLADATFNWLTRLAEWGDKYEIDPLDVNNYYKTNRWERRQAAQELQQLFATAPTEQVANIGRKMVGSFQTLMGRAPSDDRFGFTRPSTSGTAFAFKNKSFF